MESDPNDLSPTDKVDFIDLANANLAMRATVANEGTPVNASESLVWFHFLQSTWRKLDDFDWERRHAA